MSSLDVFDAVFRFFDPVIEERKSRKITVLLTNIKLNFNLFECVGCKAGEVFVAINLVVGHWRRLNLIIVSQGLHLAKSKLARWFFK